MAALSAVLARSIAAERVRRGWTQAGLGERIGISRSQVGHLETGERSIPLDLLPRLCEAFGVGLADLLSGADAADRRALRL